MALLLWLLPPLFGWSVFHAVFAPDNAACRAAHEHGACWGVIAEKGRLILFGRYPFEEQWRPLAACAALIALLVASCLRPFWKPWLAPLWVLVLAVVLHADARRRVRPHAGRDLALGRISADAGACRW